MSRGLTSEQQAEFNETGLLRLPGAVPRADAGAMAEALWDELARRHKVHKDQPETWRRSRVAQLTGPARSGAFAAMASPDVRAAINWLIWPSGWSDPSRWGLPLVTLPERGPAWDVPHQHWHLDAKVGPGEPEPPIARVFVILAPLEPHGGGTLLVQGSHRLMQRSASEAGAILTSAEARRAIKRRHSWFAALDSHPDGSDRVRRFMEEGEDVEGVNVRVVEMTGGPGDVWLMHPYLLHAFSANRRDTPRMVLTQWIYGRSAAARPVRRRPGR